MSNYIEKISETRFFFSDEDIDKLQSSVLDKTTGDNTWLAPHAIPTLARNLNTSNKRVIKAINELLSRIDSLDDSTIDIAATYDKLIGDTKENPQLEDDLLKMAPHIIDALKKNFKAIYGLDLDNPIELTSFETSAISGSLNEAINQLKSEFILMEQNQNVINDWEQHEKYEKYQLVVYNNLLFRTKNYIEDSIIDPLNDATNWKLISTPNIVTKIDRYVLTTTNINNRFVMLSEEPENIDDIFVQILGGTIQKRFIDYDIDDIDNKKIIWEGYQLQQELEVWDELVITYNYIVV